MISTPRLQSVLSPDQQAEAVSRIPLGRAGVGSDVAGVAVFLASEASSYITGQVITVDGGSCLT
jgi:NAD(P)-dependent dehydrogenase (short-subunit alcohol dehydrogenase family)